MDQVTQWNGSVWSQLSTPDPAGKGSSQQMLQGIACTSASNCWAVGSYQPDGGAATLNQALHWDGHVWSSVATPNPGGTTGEASNALGSVTCTSASNCWSVGIDRPNSQSTSQNEILLWNGTKWSKASTPEPGGWIQGNANALFGVSCESATTCWAVGSYTINHFQTERNQVLRWNGSTWSSVNVPNPAGTSGVVFNQLTSINCRTGNCWAVGSYQTNNGQTTLSEALHWNGSAWTSVPIPDPASTNTGASNNLYSVTCSGSYTCWAVGRYSQSSGAPTTDTVLRWGGSSWAVASIKSSAGGSSSSSNQLAGVACASSKSCWAVGSESSSNQALYWDGTSWTPA